MLYAVKRERDDALVVAHEVRARFVQGATTQEIAAHVGLTPRRVQQLVSDLRVVDDVRPSDDILDWMVLEQRRQLGENYGTLMMQGALRAAYPGFAFARERVADSMARQFPLEVLQRRHWATLKLARSFYYAPYTFYSLHLDFDGKFQEYGLQIAPLIDGCSRYVFSLTCHTTKIPLEVVDAIFVPHVAVHGFPEQLVTDKGAEWLVVSFICNVMQRRQGIGGREMHHVVDDSKFNTRVEKFNYEVNVRVYIKLRKLTNYMEAAGLLSKSLPRHVGAFSLLAQPLVQVGLDRCRRAWNEHVVKPVAGWPKSGGRPSARVRSYPPRAGRAVLPANYDAAADFEAVMGSTLRREPEGAARRDALHGRPAEQLGRQAAVAHAVGHASAADLWDDLVSERHDRFVAAYVTHLSYA
jgi:hypothetical protein